MKTYSVLFVSIFLLCLPGHVFGEVSGSPERQSESLNAKVETLPELIQTALKSHPELRFYEAEMDIARASLKLARSQGETEVSGSVGRKNTRDAAGAGGDGMAWSVGISQSFEWPGRIALRKAIANQDLTLAELGLNHFRQALKARIRGEAMALSATLEKAKVAREVADRYRQLREILVMRDPAGIAPQLELRVLEANELTLRRKATESELAGSDAQYSLNQLLGRPMGQPLSVALPRDLVLPDLPSEGQLIASAQTNHFDLQIRIVELEQQGFRVALARNERWPALKIGPEFSEENSGGRDRILGVGFSVPIPLWKNTSHRIAVEKSREMQAEVLLHRQRLETERSVLAASRAYRSKREELVLWRVDSIQHFSDAATLADRHFRLGAVPASIYVELQRQYLDAVETLLDTWKEAIAAASDLEEKTGLTLLPAITPTAP